MTTSRRSAQISLVLLGTAGLGLTACSPEQAATSAPAAQEQTTVSQNAQPTYSSPEAQALQEQAAALQAQAAQLEAQALQTAQAEQTDQASADNGSGVGTMLGAAAAGAAAGYLASKAANNRATAAAQTAQTPTTTQQPVQSQAATNANNQKAAAAQNSQDARTGTNRSGFGATGGATGAGS